MTFQFSTSVRTFTSYVVVYRREMALTLFGAIIIFAVLGYISDHYLNSRPLTLVFLALIIIPSVFIMVIMRYLTREVTIQLGTESIVFDIWKQPNETERRIRRFAMSDIASYQIQFPNDRFACLILKLKSGKKHEFSFRRQKLYGKQSETDAMLEVLHKFFEQHAIEFAPSFYASQKGLYTIIFLLLLLCVPFAIAAHLNKNVPLTIAGSVLLMRQIISKRVNELNFYRKWKRL